MYLRLFLSIVCLLGCANFAHAAPFAYIANNTDNTVSVIDTATNTVAATVTVDQQPYGVAVNPAGSRVYVSNQTGKSLSVIDTATNAVASVTLAYTPGGLAVNPAGTRLYVANNDNLSVSVIDINPASPTYLSVLNTATVGQNLPDGVALRPYSKGMAGSPADNRVYVSSFGGNKVSVFDAALLETNPAAAKLADITVGAPAQPTDVTAPKGIAVTPDGTKVYVANLNTNKVSVIDTATNTVTTNIAVGTWPYGVAIDPAGAKVYVSNSGSGDTVSVIDSATNTVSGTVTLAAGASPNGIAVSSTGKVLTANSLANTASIINAATNAVITSPAVGQFPQSLGSFIGPELFAITLSPGSDGTITPVSPLTLNASNQVLAAKGFDQTFNITPDRDFARQSVTVDGVAQTPVLASYTFTNVTAPHTIAATFNRVSYTVNIIKYGTGTGRVVSSPAGLDCGSVSCSASFPLNSSVTLSATADPGTDFQGWGGGGCSGAGTCGLTMNGIYADIFGNYNITAYFGLKPVTTLQAAYNALPSPAGGTISCAATYSENFDANRDIPATLQPASANTTLTGSFTVSAGTVNIGTGGTFIIM